MKISEKLYEAKRKEGELSRLRNKRDLILRQTFRDELIVSEKSTEKELQARKKEFNEKKVEKYKALTDEIEALEKEIIEIRNDINIKNVNLGLDRKLIRMKYLRIELSTLMKLNERFSSIDVETQEMLGISEKIKELEDKKTKLDLEIQNINYSQDIK